MRISQNRKVSFADAVFEAITHECEPQDVFDDDVLCDYVRDNFEPGDVYSQQYLEEWAEANGYVQKED